MAVVPYLMTASSSQRVILVGTSCDYNARVLYMGDNMIDDQPEPDKQSSPVKQ